MCHVEAARDLWETTAVADVVSTRQSGGSCALPVVPLYGTAFHYQSSTLVRQGQSGDARTMPQRLDLCSAADIEPGNALKVESGDLSLAVFNVDGEFFVTDDLCTHGPGSLSEGYIDGDVVECNFHNGQFNIKSGEVVSPPCMVPIKTYKTMVENGRVFIETD
jgi:biphenyl 2,3-dioxygenase ferredoxin component